MAARWDAGKSGTGTFLSVRFVGLRQTLAALEKVGVETADLKTAFGDISKRVAESAKGITRDRTHALDAGIRGGRRKNAAVITSRQPNNPDTGRRPYHRYVYFGTGHGGAPLPYLELAALQNRYWIRAAVERNLQTAISKAGL